MYLPYPQEGAVFILCEAALKEFYPLIALCLLLQETQQFSYFVVLWLPAFGGYGPPFSF